MPTQFVEYCFAITTRDLLRRYDRIRKLGVNNLERRPGINYWFDNMDEPTAVFLSVDGHEPQEFAWETIEITFGERGYFRCTCDRRASKLYLPPGSTKLLCRACHGLQYRLSSFNSRSVAGQAIYRMNRLQKLVENRSNMSRIFYNGNYSKRFRRFLRLCDRAGLKSIVTGANDLKALIQQ